MRNGSAHASFVKGLILPRNGAFCSLIYIYSYRFIEHQLMSTDRQNLPWRLQWSQILVADLIFDDRVAISDGHTASPSDSVTVRMFIHHRKEASTVYSSIHSLQDVYPTTSVAIPALPQPQPILHEKRGGGGRRPSLTISSSQQVIHLIKLIIIIIIITFSTVPRRRLFRRFNIASKSNAQVESVYFHIS